MTDTDAPIAIGNARVVTPSTVEEPGYVAVHGRRIVAVGEGPPPDEAERVIDADGRLVLPGLVDLHGDDIERHLAPRSEARVPADRALVDCDRANVAAGVTTKLHAVAFEDAPGDDRSLSRAREVVEAVRSTGPTLVDHRVHARCELTDPESVDSVVDILDDPVVDLVSLMTHVPGAGQFADAGGFEQRYTDGGDVSPAEVERVAERRANTTAAAIDRRLDRVVRAARAAGIPVASHDDEDPGSVERRHGRGVTICEYPVALPAARRAREVGMVTAMGAPNLVRGGSLWGNLDASAAIDAGVLDVLCSDYHPPSMLRSIVHDDGESLVERVARVTRRPAAAVGLSDRGRLEPGARADLLVVDPEPRPAVRRAFVAGTEVYATRPPGAAAPADED